jgi:hypothetical protein
VHGEAVLGGDGGGPLGDLGRHVAERGEPGARRAIRRERRALPLHLVQPVTGGRARSLTPPAPVRALQAESFEAGHQTPIGVAQEDVGEHRLLPWRPSPARRGVGPGHGTGAAVVARARDGQREVGRARFGGEVLGQHGPEGLDAEVEQHRVDAVAGRGPRLRRQLDGGPGLAVARAQLAQPLERRAQLEAPRV